MTGSQRHASFVATMSRGRTTRFTSTPDSPTPQLLCPICDLPLVYRQTAYGGVKPLERWDYLECRTCGAFQYRHRTRELRAAGARLSTPYV
jgi:hypothetical protein